MAIIKSISVKISATGGYNIHADFLRLAIWMCNFGSAIEGNVSRETSGGEK
jgi:hypothetical protein